MGRSERGQLATGRTLTLLSLSSTLISISAGDTCSVVKPVAAQGIPEHLKIIMVSGKYEHSACVTESGEVPSHLCSPSISASALT